MLEKLFGSSPPLEEVIPKAIRRLKIQHVKLERVVVRLRKRDQILFKRCTIAVENKNRERAIILANELAEIRKLIGTVTQTQIVIERIIIRLETIKELKTIVIDLKPVVSVLQDVTKSLDKAMPEVALELGKVSDTITETLASTQISSSEPIQPLNMKTPGSEQILNEVSGVLEDELANKLPEPPFSLPMREGSQRVEETRQAVALAASCSEAYEQRDTREYVYKDMEMQRLSLRIQRSAIEDQVLDYAKSCQGQFDVSRCAVELNVTSQDVKKALESLGDQGKIRIRAVQ
ncbi:hypothetical protein GWN63_05370 [Candidatus Bathyarchaeota archaeon]|nr:hypothetical protein [Candidatus Bathyarchaeota archaeon]NIU81654.1 hypothetical protein [Candidatus Bathyarchaeota archaeon]NIV68296.1 hypothetical protein [Candidatus Bathyarchaeota archaeon]NIW15880.1 hypothetical protein [Candidatus Bathyarchaeota archaeon]NIW34842.1 hypothetical protein [Candidatus Bathyarchaeota archaeon]